MVGSYQMPRIRNNGLGGWTRRLWRSLGNIMFALVVDERAV